MLCECCSKKKKLFESFSLIKHRNKEIKICVGCNDLLFKIRDDSNESNFKLQKKHLELLQQRKNNSTSAFLAFEKEFMSRYKIKSKEM